MVFTKMKKNARRLVCCALLISICVGLSGCEIVSFYSFCKSMVNELGSSIKEEKYAKSFDPDWMVGKTSIEIEEKHGAFHNCYAELGPDGKYRNGYCRYTVKEGSEGSAPHPPTYLKVVFDEAGVCTKAYCYEPPWT